jgi:hypothetical protein
MLWALLVRAGADPLACDVTCLTCNDKFADRSTCQSCESILTLVAGNKCQINRTTSAVLRSYLTLNTLSQATAPNWTLKVTGGSAEPILPERLLYNKAACNVTNLIGQFSNKDEVSVTWSLPSHNFLYIKFLVVNAISPFKMAVKVDNVLAYTHSSEASIFRTFNQSTLCELTTRADLNNYTGIGLSHFGPNVTLSFTADWPIDIKLSSLYPDTNTIRYSLRDFLLIIFTCEICPDTAIATDVNNLLLIFGSVLLLMTVIYIIVLVSNAVSYNQSVPVSKNFSKMKTIKTRF